MEENKAENKTDEVKQIDEVIEKLKKDIEFLKKHSHCVRCANPRPNTEEFRDGCCQACKDADQKRRQNPLGMVQP